jgi:hypothetical protein
MPRLRLIPLVTLVVSSIFVVGCGSGREARLSRDGYLQRIREIEAGPDARSAGRLFFELVVEPRLSRKACLARARTFDHNLHQIVEDVASLRPPRPIQTLHARFVAAARQSVAEVDNAVRDVQAGKLACGVQMNRRIYGLPSTRRAQDALDELGKRGYRIGANSE